jgi:hypothetical protein
MTGTVRLFALLAGALVLLIAVELFMPSGGAPEEVAVAPQAAPADDATAQDGGNGPTEYADTILERPLFKPDRHPYPVDGRAPLAAPPADLPRLTGILMSSDARHAIFEPDGSKPIVVAEGDNVGDWRVQEIAPDSVTLTGPEGTTRVQPKFSTAQVVAPGADAAAAADAGSPDQGEPPSAPRLGAARHKPMLPHDPAKARKQRNGGLHPPQRKS